MFFRYKQVYLALCMLVLCTCAFQHVTYAQTNAFTKLLASDGDFLDSFGWAVDVDGDRAVVGANTDEANGDLSGSAYIFEFDGTIWSQVAKLTASDGEEVDQFGYSVAVDGDRVVIGAPFNDEIAANSGAVYIFEFDGTNWNETEKLKASDADNPDRFGFSVSLSGNRVITGAPQNEDDGSFTGSAYIFDYDGTDWNETKIVANDTGRGDLFGWAVSIDGDRALIGAIGTDDAAPGVGSAYVFEYEGDSWNQTFKMTNPDGLLNDAVGSSVSLDGDRALIGAPFDEENGANAGAAFIFDYNGSTWNMTQKLLASNSESSDNFGSSVSLSGGYALVSSLGRENFTGMAYLFGLDGGTWEEQSILQPDDIGAGDNYGQTVALSGNIGFVGASATDDLASNSGSVYVYDFDLEITDPGPGQGNDIAKLLASDGDFLDAFGYAVDIDGDRAVIGASSDDENGDFSGSAYIFEFDGADWSEVAKLTASDGQDFDKFGNSVAVDGDRIVVGTPFNDENGENSGTAYIFEFDGTNWNETEKLTASDAGAFDRFGFSVSLSGNRALVGAYENDDDGFESGSAYIFEFDGTDWNETKITASDAVQNDFFGWAVSIFSNRALIGAIGTNDNAPNGGSVYVFEFDGSSWNETAELSNPDALQNDQFGWSVSLEGDRALIGAPFEEDNLLANSGAAYIFDYNGTSWSQTDKLLASNRETNDQFGHAVSLSGDLALVSALRKEMFTGMAYLFGLDGGTWGEQSILQPGDIGSGDRFGQSVALAGNIGFVGAQGTDDLGTGSGSVYIYEFEVEVTVPPCPDELVISDFQVTPSGNQFVNITNVGEGPVPISGCSVVTFNAFTELSIGDATAGLSGTLAPGETFSTTFVGELPATFGSIGLFNISPPPADGTPFSIADEVTGMVYLSNDGILGISHLTAPALNNIYACIYGGSGLGPFFRPFSEVSGCLGPAKTAGSHNPISMRDMMDELEVRARNDRSSETPEHFALKQNYPNPFNPQTIIRFGVPETSHVRLTVYDVLGREVQVLVNGQFAAGWHEVNFDATGLPSGMYLYRLETPAFTQHQTMTLTK